MKNMSGEFDASESMSPAPGVPSLNSSQTEKILHFLAHRMTLIQASPGTEKIETSVNIAYYLWNKTGSAVLICVPSNTEVFNLMEKFMEIEEDSNIIRVDSKGEFLHPNDKLAGRSLDRLVLEKHPELWMLWSPLDNRDRLRLKKLKKREELKELEKMTENELLEKARFVLCTYSVAGDDRLVGHAFQSCIIECVQSVKTETTIPIRLFRSDRIVVVGDQNGLPPTAGSQDAVKAGMGISLFQSFTNIGFKVTQYNIPSAFPSKELHTGNIKDVLTVEESEIVPSSQNHDHRQKHEWSIKWLFRFIFRETRFG